MSRIHSVIGIIIGFIIIIFSVMIFSYDVNLDTHKTNSVKYEDIARPESESNEYYGGDAYTGMQQAAAQAANNLIPVYDAIIEGNGAIKVLNGNMVSQAEQTVENMTEIISAIQYFFGLLLLSIGLITVAKYLEGLFVKQ